ncbi:hypothetical protein ACU4GG_41640 [Streptomyces nojiriensis]
MIAQLQGAELILLLAQAPAEEQVQEEMIRSWTSAGQRRRAPHAVVLKRRGGLPVAAYSQVVRVRKMTR